MFKFILIFFYLSFYTLTDVFSIAPTPPTPQQKFSIFKSLNTDYKKHLIYREIIPIIATGNKQESFNFRTLILENKITGEKKIQIQLFYDPNTNTNVIDTKSTNTNIVTPVSKEFFNPLSIAFNNNKFLPIVKSSQQLLNLMESTNSLKILSLPCVGIVDLFPDDVTNLIVSITKDPLSILQPPFPPADFSRIPVIQQSLNQFVPIELSAPSKKLYITLKNNQGEKVVLSFSPYYTAVLKATLDFYIKLI